MTSNNEIRSRSSLDFGDFDDFKENPKSKPQPAKHQKIAESEGFTSRQSKTQKTKIVDGRSLRSTGRTSQLNIAVKTETKNSFWQLAQDGGYSRGEEFLKELLELWEKQYK